MRHFARAAAACLLVMLFTSLNPVLASPHRNGRTTVTLQLRSLPRAEFAGFFVAQAKGFYTSQHLTVKILSGRDGVPPETSVESGEANFGIDWMASLLRARDGEYNLVNIAQLFQLSGMRMITFKKSGIRTVNELAGHTVGAWPQEASYPFFALMKKQGVNCSAQSGSCDPSTNVQVVQQDPGTDAFMNGSLDVAQAMNYDELGVLTEPSPAGHGYQKKTLNIFDYNKLGVSILEDGIFGDAAWLKKHKKTAVRFLTASIDGWRWAVNHPVQAGRLSYDYIPAGEGANMAHQVYMAETVAKLVSTDLHGHPIGWMNPTAFKRSWMETKQCGAIQGPKTGAYDQTYLLAATKHE